MSAGPGRGGGGRAGVEEAGVGGSRGAGVGGLGSCRCLGRPPPPCRLWSAAPCPGKPPLDVSSWPAGGSHPHLVMVSTRTSGFSGSCAGGTLVVPVGRGHLSSPERWPSEFPSVVSRSDSAPSRWSGKVQAQTGEGQAPPDLTSSSAALQARNSAV